MTKQTYRVVGVMSGTSLDGVDLCEVIFYLKNEKWNFEIMSAKTVAYPKHWTDILKNAHHLSKREVQKIDVKYTKYLSEVITAFIKNSDEIDLICSHGHTIWHQPEQNFTYQIGNLPELAKLLNKPVICDFRKADVKLGGQGAPLVPVGDKLLFSEFDYCINLGGFVNISFRENEIRKAFDVCPANKVLNYYAEKLGLDFDDKGKIASSGKFNAELFEYLNALDFYKKPPPKSLGVEWLDTDFFPILKSFHIPIEDKLYTLCHHIAFQISKVIKAESVKVLVTGGGSYHDFLMNCIKKYAKYTKIIVPEKNIIEYKEALIFGLLGVLRYRCEHNVYSSVTGAENDHSSGEVFL